MNKVKKGIAVVSVFLVTLVFLSFIGGGMTTLDHQITVKAPKEKVFETLADLEKVQHYNPTVRSAKYITDKHRGEGAARECDLGKDGTVRERVIDYKEGQWIKMELYEHNWPIEKMEWTTRLQSVDEKTTHISQTMTYQMKFGLLGGLLNKLVMKNKLDNTLTNVFESMKTYVEADASRTE